MIRRFRAGANVEAFRDRYIQEGDLAKIELERIARDLIQTLASASPIYLIAGVVIFCILGPDQENDISYFFTRDVLIEYLCGLAASILHPKEERPHPEMAFEAFIKLREIPPLLESNYLGEKMKETSREGTIDDIRFFLGIEDLFDRMEGYTPHLESIVKASFEPIRSECLKHLGFSPADIPAIVRAVVERRRIVLNEVVTEARKTVTEAASAGISLPKSHRNAMMLTLMYKRFSDEIAFEPIEDLAGRSGIPPAQVRLILGAMSCPWGVQPSYSLPEHENRFRLFPVFQIDQNFSIPLPWSLLHQCFKWFEAYGKENAPGLLGTWHKTRDRVAESIVRNELEKIFSTECTFGPLKYEVDGNLCEADAAVILPPWGIAVEVKAHSLTPSGRRGAPGRLRKKAEELIELPISQAERFSRFLKEGGKEVVLSDGRRVELPKIEQTSMLVATFERIDPLSHVASELPKAGGRDQRIWAICLADLLMVTEILRRPCEFWFYSCLRTEIGSNRKLTTTMEADILAGFLRDRLSEFIKQSQQVDGRILLDYCADSINQYFTGSELGTNVEVPTLGIPSSVLDELDRLIKTQNRQWPELVDRAMRQPRKEWRRLSSVTKKVRRTGTPRRLSFREPDLDIVVCLNSFNPTCEPATKTPQLMLMLS